MTELETTNTWSGRAINDLLAALQDETETFTRDETLHLIEYNTIIERNNQLVAARAKMLEDDLKASRETANRARELLIAEMERNAQRVREMEANSQYEPNER